LVDPISLRSYLRRWVAGSPIQERPDMLILVLRNTHVMMPLGHLGHFFTCVSIHVQSDSDVTKSGGFTAFDPGQLFDEQLLMRTLVPSF
jgi:hypothetical protein